MNATSPVPTSDKNSPYTWDLASIFPDTHAWNAEAQAILREAEAGMAVAELLRKHGISRPTFYLWKQKFGGAGVPEL
jgi:hypothetical protein